MKNKMKFIYIIIFFVIILFFPVFSPAAESDELLNDAGLVYYYRGQYSDALKLFLNAAGVNPKNPEVYFNIGRSYNKLKKPLEAMNALQKAVELKPNYAVAKTVLKKVEAELAKKDKSSVQTFSRNYRIQMPQELAYPYPDFTAGFYAYYDGDRPDSEEKFERDMKKSEKAVQAIMDQAIIKYHTGYFDDAARLFQKAAGTDPGNASAWFDLGLSYEQSGRQQDAIDSYQKAVRADPKLTEAGGRLLMVKDNLLMNQMNAADSAFKSRQWAKAIKLYEMAGEMALPHSPEYMAIESRINLAKLELDRIKERQKEINQAFLSRNIDFFEAAGFPSRYIGSLVTWSGEPHDVETYGMTTDIIMYHSSGSYSSQGRKNYAEEKARIFIIRFDKPISANISTHNVYKITVVGRIASSERLRNAFKYGDYTDKIVVKPLKIEVFER